MRPSPPTLRNSPPPTRPLPAQSPSSSPPTWGPAAAFASRRTTSITAPTPWTPGSGPPPSTISRSLTSGKIEYSCSCSDGPNNREPLRNPPDVVYNRVPTIRTWARVLTALRPFARERRWLGMVSVPTHSSARAAAAVSRCAGLPCRPRAPVAGRPCLFVRTRPLARAIQLFSLGAAPPCLWRPAAATCGNARTLHGHAQVRSVTRPHRNPPEEMTAPLETLALEGRRKRRTSECGRSNGEGGGRGGRQGFGGGCHGGEDDRALELSCRREKEEQPAALRGSQRFPRADLSESED
uniref:Uncharacterized protein n=1 Tax=Arundo donax TaxID=35708 RepID=A0A0A9EM73_ARUDO